MDMIQQSINSACVGGLFSYTEVVHGWDHLKVNSWNAHPNEVGCQLVLQCCAFMF